MTFHPPPRVEKVLTFRVATLPDYRRVTLQTFRIAIGLFRVALLPLYPGFCDSPPPLTGTVSCTTLSYVTYLLGGAPTLKRHNAEFSKLA